MTQIWKESIARLEESVGIDALVHRKPDSVDKFDISFRIRTKHVQRQVCSARDIALSFMKSSAKTRVTAVYSASSKNSTPTSVRVRHRMRARRLMP